MKPKNDGGPAFPDYTMEDDGTTVAISKFAPGLSLRDWFAGQALTALIPREGWIIGKAAEPIQETAEQAYQMADAMLKERSK